MASPDELGTAILDLARTLDPARIDWFVVGGAAMGLLGAPRPTRGLDVVADLPPGRVEPVVALFALAPFDVQPAAVREAIPRRRPLRGVHRATSVPLTLFPRKMGYFDDGRFGRARDVELAPGCAVRVASPEDVVLKKLESYRFEHDDKHRLDVLALLAAVGATLDRDYLEGWLDGLGVRDAWDDCQRAL